MLAAAGTDLRLAELIAWICPTTDLGMGQPMEQALRTCLIALALGRRRGCSGQTIIDARAPMQLSAQPREPAVM